MYIVYIICAKSGTNGKESLLIKIHAYSNYYFQSLPLAWLREACFNC